MVVDVAGLVCLVIMIVTSITGVAISTVSMVSNAEMMAASDARKIKGIYYTLCSALARGAGAHNTMCRCIASMYTKAAGRRRRRTMKVFLSTASGPEEIDMPLVAFNIERVCCGHTYRFRVIPKYQQGMLKILGFEIRDRRELIPPKHYWDNLASCHASIERELYGA